MPWLAGILVAFALIAQSSTAHPKPQSLEEGDLIVKSELPLELPADNEHPSARKLISTDEGEIRCEPTPQKIIVAHYRAESTAQFSMKDDLVLIAVQEGDKFEILQIMRSETAVLDGGLISDDDFEEEFITIDGIQFLYIRRRVSGSGGIVEHNVYTISSDRKLSIVPFQDVSKSTLLKEHEELRNGDYRFAKGSFTFESAVYKPQDGECCPSLGDFDAEFKLEGKFHEDLRSHVFEPDFRFVATKQSRSPKR